MQVSDSGKAMIKHFEGLSLTAYPDANGYSIGYGHYGASPGQVITQAQADQLFNQDLQIVEAHLNSFSFSLNQNQFDALADFVYNVGVGQFNNSTLLRNLEAGNFSAAANEFGRWVYSNGKKLPSLIERRAAEAALFLAGTAQTAATAATKNPLVAIGIALLLLFLGFKILT